VMRLDVLTKEQIPLPGSQPWGRCYHGRLGPKLGP
jgi:hypothetical protein